MARETDGWTWRSIWVLIDKQPQFEDEAVVAAYESWDELLELNRFRAADGIHTVPLPDKEPTAVMTDCGRYTLFKTQLVGGPRRWLPEEILRQMGKIQ